jgi:hypothetical protein
MRSSVKANMGTCSDRGLSQDAARRTEPRLEIELRKVIRVFRVFRGSTNPSSTTILACQLDGFSSAGERWYCYGNKTHRRPD